MSAKLYTGRERRVRAERSCYSAISPKSVTPAFPFQLVFKGMKENREKEKDLQSIYTRFRFSPQEKLLTVNSSQLTTLVLEKVKTERGKDRNSFPANSIPPPTTARFAREFY